MHIADADKPAGRVEYLVAAVIVRKRISGGSAGRIPCDRKSVAVFAFEFSVVVKIIKIMFGAVGIVVYQPKSRGKRAPDYRFLHCQFPAAADAHCAEIRRQRTVRGSKALSDKICIEYMAHRNRQYIAVRNGIAVIVYKVPVETVYITCSRFTEGMCRIAPYPLKAFCVTVFDDKNRMRGVVIAVVGRREFDAVPR